MGSECNAFYIDQININSVNNKKSEISLLADSRAGRNGNVICLNDTRLTKSKRLKIKGYRTIRKDHKSGKSKPGGVAILCKNHLKVNEISCSIDEMIIIEIVLDHLLVRLGTVYLHPG